ncbi:RHS repeat protein, partial [Cysteiniphilum litorale]|uniref:RHS repeat protein n=1 Tax=Cysteiniphilum litorale TaxID=2056700 RepID=UPI0013001CDC
LRETEQTDNSSKTKFVYDANGNVSSIIYSASADNSIPVAPTVNNSYDPNNNLATTTAVDAANKPLSSITFGYDALNRLTSMSFADGYGLGNGSLNYTYDDNGSLTSIHYPDGLIISYNPNPLGNPTQLVRTDSNFQTLVVGDIKYSPFNTITSYQGGVNVTHTLDAMGRISNIAAGSIVNRTYSYDGENNVLSITNNLNTSENESFTYDYANRLITANGVWGAASYHYDMGNNITQLQVGSQTNNYTYSTNNLLTAITGSTNENITYDANGNVIQKGDDHYLYDAAGHLIHFNNASHTIDFKYDPLGHVITTREDEKRLLITVYDRDGKLMYKENRDLVNNTNEITDYIYLEGKLVATATHSVYDAQNVTFHYLITNPLGSPIASITNGQVDWTQSYRPFGIELKERPTPGDHIGFTGKETVKDMNLVNMNARYYAPSLGRFMAYDPAPPEVDNIF